MLPMPAGRLTSRNVAVTVRIAAASRDRNARRQASTERAAREFAEPRISPFVAATKCYVGSGRTCPSWTRQHQRACPLVFVAVSAGLHSIREARAKPKMPCPILAVRLRGTV